MIRKLGWKLDYPDDRDYQLPMGLAAPVAKLQAASHIHVRGPVLEQVGQSCVGCALARAWYMSLRLQGGQAGDTPMASPPWGYSIALAQEYAGHSAAPKANLDRGCYPRLAMQAIRAMGMATSDQLGWGLVDEPRRRVYTPTPIVQMQAYDQRGFEYFRLTGTGDDRVQQVSAALRAGLPVVFGVYVDSDYCNHVGTKPIRTVNSGAILGGHMQAVLEVEPTGIVLVDNWWGPSWGYHGVGYLAPELFGSVDMISDVYAIKAQPFVEDAA